jgi:hypothetical protein
VSLFLSFGLSSSCTAFGNSKWCRSRIHGAVETVKAVRPTDDEQGRSAAPMSSRRNTANSLLADPMDSGEDDGNGSGSDMKHPLSPSQLRGKL